MHMPKNNRLKNINTITKQFYSLTSKFKWTLNNNRIEKIILIPNVVTIFFFFFEVSALLVGHCPKIQSCAISRKTNDATLTKLPTSWFQTQNFFSWILTLLVVRQCSKLSSYAIFRKTNETNLEIWQKT